MTRRVFPTCFVAILLPLWAAGADEPAGVRNFHAVNDHVYRGAQPTAEGFANLGKLGVKTVIDLRRGDEHKESEQEIVERAGMRYIHIPLNGYEAPSNDNVAKILALLDDSPAWPVFIHCRRGADRTGTVIACYRVAHDHWTNGKALTEAKLHGMSWTEIWMQRYVMQFKPLPSQPTIGP
jgi:tyrosine-protein phosphatase SIW14